MRRHNKKLSYGRDNAGRQSLRRSRSFKVTDFGANRKPACDFLFVNNTNLYPISRTVCQMSRSIDQIIAFDSGCLSLTKSLSEISHNIAISHMLPKAIFFKLHLFRRQYRSIFNRFYVSELVLMT